MSFHNVVLGGLNWVWIFIVCFCSLFDLVDSERLTIIWADCGVVLLSRS